MPKSPVMTRFRPDATSRKTYKVLLTYVREHELQGEYDGVKYANKRPFRLLTFARDGFNHAEAIEFNITGRGITRQEAIEDLFANLVLAGFMEVKQW